MLINFSNHPSNHWPDRQKEEALRLYREIIDLNFPNIDPSAKEEDIICMAKEYVKKIFEIRVTSKSEPFAVHIMGEMTFTFAVVQMLLREGIDCLASTTRRITEEKKINNEVVKTSRFEFVQFRKYQII